MSNRAQKQLRGFSLIEILVVLVIRGLDQRGGAHRAQQRHTRFKRFSRLQIDRDREDLPPRQLRFPYHRAGPRGTHHTGTLGQNPGISNKAVIWPRCRGSVGRPYLYLSPGEYRDVDLYSLGADGLPGGEGQNADIGNWNEADARSRRAWALFSRYRSLMRGFSLIELLVAVFVIVLLTGT